MRCREAGPPLPCEITRSHPQISPIRADAAKSTLRIGTLPAECVEALGGMGSVPQMCGYGKDSLPIGVNLRHLWIVWDQVGREARDSGLLGCRNACSTNRPAPQTNSESAMLNTGQSKPMASILKCIQSRTANTRSPGA